MFKNLSLKIKLLGTFAFLSVILILVGGLGFYFLKDISNKYHHIAKVNLANAVELGKMHSNALDAQRSLLQAEVTTNPQIFTWNLNNVSLALDNYEEADKVYNSVEFVEGEKALYDTQNTKWKELSEIIGKIVATLENKTPENKARFLELSLALPGIHKDHSDGLHSLIDFQRQESQKWTSLAEAAVNKASLLSLIFVIGGVILSLLFGFIFSNSLASSLRVVNTKLTEAARSTSSASAELASAAQQLSSGASEGAASLEETVSSLEELASMVRLNADNAKEAAALSQASRHSAEEGEAEIKKLIASVSDVAKSSKEIEEIINVIDGIAFQTNLLALNAAVEAARAGEQGRGFAVVAEAVRNLAQQSAVAAKDITKLIKNSVDKTEGGVKIADQSGVLLKEIVVSVKKVADLNLEISSASQQQSSGLNQISKAMSQLDQVTQSNAASAEEAAASSEEMSGQATILQDQVKNLTKIIDGKISESSVHQSSMKKNRNLDNIIPFNVGKQGPKEIRKTGTIDGF